MRWTPLLCSMPLLAASVCQAQDSTRVPSKQASAKAPIEVDEWLIVYPPTLGGASLSIARGRGSEREGTYYYLPPYFHYDIASFRAAVEGSCANSTSGTQTAYLPVRFASKAVNEEIAATLKNVALERLRPYPVGLIRIATGAYNSANQVSPKTRLILPPGALDAIEDGYLAPANTFDTELHMIPVEDTCQSLRAIAQNTGDIQAWAYSQLPDTRINFFSAELNSVLEALDKSNLIQSQGNTGYLEVRTASGSRSIGLNAGGVFGGSSKSTDRVTTVDQRGRWVTSNLLQDALRDYSAQLSVFRLSEASEAASKTASNSDREQLQDAFERKALAFVLAQSPYIKARFDKVAEGQWQIMEERIDKTTLNDLQVKELLKTSVKPELNGTNKVSGEYGTIKGAVDQTANVKDERGIEWSRDGSSWIPVSADLHFINKADLQSRVYASFDDVTLTGSKAVYRLPLRGISNAFAAPNKHAIELKAGLYKTIAYWSGGQQSQTIACQPEPAAPANFTRVGATDTQVFDARRMFVILAARGCATAPYCDSAGEFCVSYHRSAGCLINNEWLAWYRSRQKEAGLPERQEDICLREEG